VPAATADIREVASRLDGIGAAYGAMARFLLAPADESLQRQLAEPGQLESWPMPRDLHTTRGLELLESSTSESETAADLNRDYQRLFVGPDSLLAPPYESVYRTVDRLLFDEPTFEVRAAYRTLGLQAPHLNREPDDHIGLEFSFLSSLCEHALVALARDDRRRFDEVLDIHRRFLCSHLLLWGGDCLGLVETNSQTLFYKGVGALGLGVLLHAAKW